MCNFLEYKDSKVVYRRYASLFFVVGIGQGDNELITLEVIHRFVIHSFNLLYSAQEIEMSILNRYVEVLDRYFGNVSSSVLPSHQHQLILSLYRSVN